MRLRVALLEAAVPAVVLLAAFILAPRVGTLPASLAGLASYGTCFVLALGALVSLAFRRGRVLLALLLLFIAYGAYWLLLRHGPVSLAGRAVFVALCLFVPLDLAMLGLLRERGTFNRHGLQRLCVILLEAAITAWVALAGKSAVVARVYAPLFDAPFLTASAVPQAGLAAMAAGLAVTVAAWFVTRSAIDLGLAGAIAAFGMAAHGVTAPNAFATFSAAGALILTIAVLQDTFRMAFRDELTGLPSRRELNERLAGLGRHYTIAMLDVDHFKRFNDTYGHDVGDQVLKMVAGKLAGVGGGGKVYRYGGEEFTVLFPRKSLSGAIPHLEALRREIAGYDLALRGGDRPAQQKSGRQRRGKSGAGRSVSVTISIGFAERNDRHSAPEDVLQAADKALYRAKNKGRNQVSR